MQRSPARSESRQFHAEGHRVIPNESTSMNFLSQIFAFSSSRLEKILPSLYNSAKELLGDTSSLIEWGGLFSEETRPILNIMSRFLHAVPEMSENQIAAAIVFLSWCLLGSGIQDAPIAYFLDMSLGCLAVSAMGVEIIVWMRQGRTPLVYTDAQPQRNGRQFLSISLIVGSCVLIGSGITGKIAKLVPLCVVYAGCCYMVYETSSWMGNSQGRPPLKFFLCAAFFLFQHMKSLSIVLMMVLFYWSQFDICRATIRYLRNRRRSH